MPHSFLLKGKIERRKGGVEEKKKRKDKEAGTAQPPATFPDNN